MKRWTADQIVALLRQKYSGDAYAFVEQVPNGTGMDKSRTCDAMAMSLWPSNGLHLYGFEVKVSRSDWLKEIQDPTKAEAFAAYCNQWWIVAPKGIVKLDELPATWGLMCPATSGNLRVARPVTIQSLPKPIDRKMLAGILRASLKQSPGRRELDAARKAGYDAGYDAASKRYANTTTTDTKMLKHEIEMLQRNVRDFEASSGITLDNYRGAEIGLAVRAVRTVGLECLEHYLKSIASELAQASTRAREAAAAIATATDDPVETETP